MQDITENLEKPADKIWDKIDGWIDTLIAMLPNMAVALLSFILFYLIAKVAQKTTSKIFNKTSSNRALSNLFSTIVFYVVVGVGIFIILEVLKLEKAVTSLLAGVGVVGLALGFAFQDVASNFLSGIILAFRRPFMLSDIVEVNDMMGIVTRTNLRVTVIKTFRGQEIYIPNKDVLQSPITNFTVLGERRIDIAVGVSYGDDLAKVESLVKDTISKIDGVIRLDDMIFDYYEFGSSSINFMIRFWVKYPDQPGYLGFRNEAIKEIKKAFDANDITIPFPIRTLDFGIKGGQSIGQTPLTIANQEH